MRDMLLAENKNLKDEMNDLNQYMAGTGEPNGPQNDQESEYGTETSGYEYYSQT